MFTSGEGENVTSHLEALLCGANGSENKLLTYISIASTIACQPYFTNYLQLFSAQFQFSKGIFQNLFPFVNKGTSL